MLITNIKDYKAGWMMGNFNPSVLRTPYFELGHHTYPAAFKGDNHRHDMSTEYNYIVRGKADVNGKILSRGDMFIFTPGEYCGSVVYLEETDLIIVKSPSAPDDKIDVKGTQMPMPK